MKHESGKWQVVSDKYLTSSGSPLRLAVRPALDFCCPFCVFPSTDSELGNWSLWFCSAVKIATSGSISR